jgi:LCP family protein required for cell wall assembly
VPFRSSEDVVSSHRSAQDDRPERPLPSRLDPRAGRTGRDSGTGSRTGRAFGVARVVAAVASVALLLTSGWGWYLGRVASATVSRTDAIVGNGRANGAEMNLLLVGSDSRADASAAELKQLNTGPNEGQNTDTMILAHVPADGSKASFVSFPRDSYVQIPGHGWDKLNAAYDYGYRSASAGANEAQKQAAGAQLLIRTISSLTGLQIDHYAEVDLLGFFKLSSAVGGVQVNLCRPVKDSFSGVNLPAGVQTISGSQALAFVRQRHGLLRGDLDRIVRQQTFIGAMIRKVLSQNVLLDPAKQRQLVEAAAGSVTVDQSLDLMQFGQQMQSVTAGSINFQTMPIVGDAKDDQGRDVLRLPDLATLHQFFAHLTADAAPVPSPSSGQNSSPAAAPPAAEKVSPTKVKVAVLNGSPTPGQAAKAATALQAAGFTVTGTGNAPAQNHSRTEVGYAAGDEKLAAAVAERIPGATAVAAAGVPAGTVQLVLGTDFTGVGAAPAGTAASSVPAAAPTADPAPRTAADTTCVN